MVEGGSWGKEEELRGATTCSLSRGLGFMRMNVSIIPLRKYTLRIYFGGKFAFLFKLNRI